MTHLDLFEAAEIADHILKVDNPNDDIAITTDACYEAWEIDIVAFHDIVNKIFALIKLGISPITHRPYVGISDDNMWLAKKDANGQFIHAIIQWLTEGDVISEGSKGFVKTITLDDKPVYDITISKSKTKK